MTPSRPPRWRADADALPTLDEIAEITSRAWVCPLHERIDQLLKTAAPDLTYGSPYWRDEDGRLIHRDRLP